jgi:threonine dehydratase
MGTETALEHREFVAAHGAAVAEAAERIRGWVRRTPLLETDLGDPLLVKAENLQVTGAFKARGAFNAVLRLREADPSLPGVIAVSSGNHAAAVANAARAVGVPAVVVIPAGANPVKVAATLALGAEVVSDGVTYANRDEVVRRIAAERGLPLVHPFDDWDVIHGQGTAALEILEDRPDLSAIVVPVGGGGLLSGTALAVRSVRPHVRVIGVEPALADDAARSFRTGSRQRLDATPATIADGVRVLAIGDRGHEVIVERRLVDDVVTVGEEELRDAVRLAWLRGRVVLEPTAALPLAAWLAGRVPGGTREAPVAMIASGGNVDPAVVAGILGGSGG